MCNVKEVWCKNGIVPLQKGIKKGWISFYILNGSGGYAVSGASEEGFAKRASRPKLRKQDALPPEKPLTFKAVNGREA